jgi:ATP-dependent DNA helicase DinG
MMNVANATRKTIEQHGRPVFVQGVDGVKNKLITDFRFAKNGVLMGVSSFWVGVDVQGEALSCVIIAKMPFERPDDPFNQATKEYMESLGKNYFADYDLPRAIMMIRQGFGRLIRTKTDRGVVILLDPRLNPNSNLKKGYMNRVLAALPQCPRTHKLDDVRAFFQQGIIIGNKEEEKPPCSSVNIVSGS